MNLQLQKKSKDESSKPKSGIGYDFQDLYDFRDLIFKVAKELKMHESTTTDVIQKLFSEGFISMPENLLLGLKDYLDQGESLLNDEQIKREAIDLLENYKIDFTNLIHELLVCYTFKAMGAFSPEWTFGVVKNKKQNRLPQVDITGNSQDISKSETLFEIKYRKMSIDIDSLIIRSIDIAKKYEIKNQKENKIINIIYIREVRDVQKILYRFKKSIDDIYPEYSNRIFLVPIYVDNLGNLEHEIKKIIGQKEQIRSKYFILFEKPKLIQINDGISIPTGFLTSTIGSLSTWVEVPSTEEILKRIRNNIYVFGHDTNMGKVNEKSQYLNAWAFRLTPDNYTGFPQKIVWTIWVSNDKGENSYLDSQNWEEGEKKWHQFLIRWNHNKPSLELLIDGKVVGVKNDYLEFWPKKISSTASIGNWVNRWEFHLLGMPLYRLITTDRYLSDTWVQNEIKDNNPIAPSLLWNNCRIRGPL